MNNLARWPAATILMALAGCQCMATAEDVPARIDTPTAESRAALQQAVSEALQTEVILAENALTTSSWLTIDRSPPQGINNPPTQGRNLGTPIQFRLVKNGAACILIDQRNAIRYALENTDCVAE